MKKTENREASHYTTFSTLLLLFSPLFSSVTPLIVLLWTPKFYVVHLMCAAKFQILEDT